ncbi:hypothetical protein GGI42DRAFT_334759 [Trichoderma sp. SZMC 28013]
MHPIIFLISTVGPKTTFADIWNTIVFTSLGKPDWFFRSGLMRPHRICVLSSCTYFGHNIRKSHFILSPCTCCCQSALHSV